MRLNFFGSIPLVGDVSCESVRAEAANSEVSFDSSPKRAGNVKTCRSGYVSALLTLA